MTAGSGSVALGKINAPAACAALVSAPREILPKKVGI